MNRVFSALAAVAFSSAVFAAGIEVVPTVELIRGENGPEGLSGITVDRKGRWWAVDDRSAKLYRATVDFDKSGSVARFAVSGGIRLEGREDVEGCASDPLRADVIYVSDEKRSTVSAHDVKTGKLLEEIAMPGDFRSQVRLNRSLEALCISSDGLRMWTANEDTLRCDGERASSKNGGKVRILAFSRSGAGAAWKFDGWSMYPTDPAGGEPFKGMLFSGLVSLADLGDGRLLALEREMSRKNPLFPSFRGRLYVFRPTAGKGGGAVEKKLVWGEDMFLSNYEGMALCPPDSSGARRLVMVSDGGGEAVEAVRSFLLKFSRQNPGKMKGKAK
jgi:hypothetical protein